MAIFSIKQKQLKKIKEISFKDEKEIQNLTEQSLTEVFDLELVKSELSLSNLRIDSSSTGLGFSCAFVCIAS